MLRVSYGDVSCAARAVLNVPSTRRARRIRAMLAEAHAGHAYLKATGRMHPKLGDGTLMAVARRTRLPPEPSLGDPDYAACVELVLRIVREWRAERVNRRRRTRSGSPPDQAPAV